MSVILILDSSQVARHVLAVVLERGCRQCLEAARLEAAVRLLGPRKVDLVLSDARIGAAGPPQIRQAIVSTNPQVRNLILADPG